MLTVHNVPADQYYCNPLGLVSSASYSFTYEVSVFFGPYNPDGSKGITLKTVEIPGDLEEGKFRNACGDNSCFHRNFEGDIYVTPFVQSFSPANGECGVVPVMKVKKGSSNYDLTHLCPDSTDSVHYYSFNKTRSPAKIGDGTGTLIVRTFNLNRVIGVGIGTELTFIGDDLKLITEKRYSLSLRTLSKNGYTVSAIINKVFSTLEDMLAFDPLPYLSTTFTGGSGFAPLQTSTHAADYNQLLDLTTHYLVDIMPTKYCDEDPDALGDLAQRCVDQQDFVDVNTLGFIVELKDVGALIPKLSGIKNPKTYASLYLWFKYGLSLTVSDSQKLLRAYEGVRTTAQAVRPNTVYASTSRVVSWRTHVFHDEYHYKLVYEPWPSDVMNFVGKARKWNLWPKLATAWDMIPFSFVVDWAVDIQSTLHQLDTRTDVEYFNSIGTCWSRKITTVSSASETFFNLPVLGSITFIDYTRRAERFIRLPRLRLELSGSFHNHLELTSLIVTKKR